MNIDHQQAANDLNIIKTTTRNIAHKSISVAAIKQANHDYEILTKLQTWHQERADEITRKKNLADLHQHTEKQLIKNN